MFLLALVPLFSADLPAIADKTKGLVRREGLLPSYVDARAGIVYLELKPDAKGVVGEFLYRESLKTGLGSNDLGLDRGQPGDVFVVRFIERGNKVLFEAVNTGFRASSGDPAEVESVRESFAPSVLFSFPEVARNPDGTVLIDATAFAVRDAHGSGRVLKARLDSDRSSLEPAGCKAFPLNLEFEARLTFAGGEEPRPEVAAITPDPRSTTLVQHQSLVKLPDTGFEPRIFDPRGGAFSLDFLDFSTPLGQPLRKKYAMRHRLKKGEALTYYVERGTPEPIRSALIEGAGWWNQAFESAGFPNGFRVELMPEGADADDARYNVIQWVHRDTRGYSIGNTIYDPRTGEILQGRVTLDSSRGRQDTLIFEGLLGADKSGTGGPGDPTQLALARLRQLAAHEVGHTLGLAHNFAATANNRASVMDYPAPRLRLKGGEIDTSDAYARGIGEWDKAAINYLYANAAPREDLLFLSDQDADERSGAEPRATRFDNDDNPATGLREALSIRALALSRFGVANIHPGQSTGELATVLGPVYFYHRYATNSALQAVGGLRYVHTVRGGKGAAPAPLPRALQLDALDALLDSIRPGALNLPKNVLNVLGPRTFGQGGSREEFSSTTTFAFDGLGAANTAADLVVAGLLNPARAERMVELSTRGGDSPTLDFVLDKLLVRAFADPSALSVREREIAMGVQTVVTERLMDLSDNGTPAVRTRANAALAQIRTIASGSDSHVAELRRRIHQFFNRPVTAPKRAPAALPALPGAPIG